MVLLLPQHFLFIRDYCWLYLVVVTLILRDESLFRGCVVTHAVPQIVHHLRHVHQGGRGKNSRSYPTAVIRSWTASPSDGEVDGTMRENLFWWRRVRHGRVRDPGG
jgi:hypothetical protein